MYFTEGLICFGVIKGEGALGLLFYFQGCCNVLDCVICLDMDWFYFLWVFEFPDVVVFV